MNFCIFQDFFQSVDTLDVPLPTYPYGKSLYKPYITWVFMGKLSPRIPRLNTIKTMVGHVR